MVVFLTCIASKPAEEGSAATEPAPQVEERKRPHEAIDATPEKTLTAREQKRLAWFKGWLCVLWFNGEASHQTVDGNEEPTEAAATAATPEVSEVSDAPPKKRVRKSAAEKSTHKKKETRTPREIKRLAWYKGAPHWLWLMCKSAMGLLTRPQIRPRTKRVPRRKRRRKQRALMKTGSPNLSVTSCLLVRMLVCELDRQATCHSPSRKMKLKLISRRGVGWLPL